MKQLLENWRQYLNEGIDIELGGEEETQPSEYIDFKRGDCSLLANVVADMLELPTYGIFDKSGDIQHVFVYDPDTDEAIDCRGRMPVRDITQNIRGDGLTYREITQQEIEDTFGTYSDEEYEYAEEEAHSII